MARSKVPSSNRLLLGLIGALLIAAAGVFLFLRGRSWPEIAVPGMTQVNSPLSADDVSWLFPAPTQAGDFAKLIRVRDLTSPDPQDSTKRDPIWPDSVFQQFLAIAASPAGQVAGTKSAIGLPPEAQSVDNWYVAGVRIDAGAPGITSDIRGQFGQSPEIRLIIQPVTHNADGSPRVLDIAGHLVFDFTLPQPDAPAQSGCLPRPQPDDTAFNSIVEDLVALRTKLSEGQFGATVTTAGVPLGVHPGMANPATATNVREEMKALLEKHLSAQRLGAMAIAGLPSGAPAPWIFLSMQVVPPGIFPALPKGGIVPVHGPTLDGQQSAQLLERVFKFPRVAPTPHTNNLNPITCRNAAISAESLPIAERRGVATADIFGLLPQSADKIKQTLDVIADPTRSHFFNTDCVSCHTETTRAMDLLNVKQIPGIDPAVMPNGAWDVRNFGWSPPASGPAQATATRRTAAETAAVVAYIDAELLARRRQ